MAIYHATARAIKILSGHDFLDHHDFLNRIEVPSNVIACNISVKTTVNQNRVVGEVCADVGIATAHAVDFLNNVHVGIEAFKRVNCEHCRVLMDKALENNKP